MLEGVVQTEIKDLCFMIFVCVCVLSLFLLKFHYDCGYDVTMTYMKICLDDVSMIYVLKFLWIAFLFFLFVCLVG